MPRYEDWTDTELLEELNEYDSSDDIRLTDWEVKFFDSAVKQSFPLTDKQRTKMIQIIRKYE
jgi:hypothetical protein